MCIYHGLCIRGLLWSRSLRKCTINLLTPSSSRQRAMENALSWDMQSLDTVLQICKRHEDRGLDKYVDSFFEEAGIKQGHEEGIDRAQFAMLVEKDKRMEHFILSFFVGQSRSYSFLVFLSLFECLFIFIVANPLAFLFSFLLVRAVLLRCLFLLWQMHVQSCTFVVVGESSDSQTPLPSSSCTCRCHLIFLGLK